MQISPYRVIIIYELIIYFKNLMKSPLLLSPNNIQIYIHALLTVKHDIEIKIKWNELISTKVININIID